MVKHRHYSRHFKYVSSDFDNNPTFTYKEIRAWLGYVAYPRPQSYKVIIIQNSNTGISDCKAPPATVSGTIIRLPGKWVHNDNLSI